MTGGCPNCLTTFFSLRLAITDRVRSNDNLSDFANARFEIAIFSKLHLFRSVQESEVSVKIRQNYYCLRFGFSEVRLNFRARFPAACCSWSISSEKSCGWPDFSG